MRTPEIFFGAVVRPLHFILPSGDIIWGEITNCTGIMLGGSDEDCWALLRTPDEMEACANWLDTLWLRMIEARRSPHSYLYYDLSLFAEGISPQFQDEYPGAENLCIEACASHPAADAAVMFGAALTDESPVHSEDFKACLSYDYDISTLASLLRDVAIAVRNGQFHYGRDNPMRAFNKTKPAPKPLLLAERRAA